MTELHPESIPRKAVRSKRVAKAATAVRIKSRPVQAAVLEEARRAGLLDGPKTVPVNFRAPPALVEAAKRATGISSTTELGELALAMLAQRDPVAEFFKRTEGRLGPDHKLEY